MLLVCAGNASCVCWKLRASCFESSCFAAKCMEAHCLWAHAHHHAAALHLFGLHDLLIWLPYVTFACTSCCAFHNFTAKCWCATRGRCSPHTLVFPSLQGEGPVHRLSHQSQRRTHEAALAVPICWLLTRCSQYCILNNGTCVMSLYGMAMFYDKKIWAVTFTGQLPPIET